MVNLANICVQIGLFCGIYNRKIYDILPNFEQITNLNMPLVESTFSPSILFRNAHFSTIYSAKLRPTPTLAQTRERIILPDSDFIDIDWSYAKTKATKVSILLHGLEGNAQRTYIKSMGKKLIAKNWDVAAVNFRGCSGEPNKKFASYNAGKTDDLDSIINFILKKYGYSEIALIGFSLGGNLLLKYLGERDNAPTEITKAIAISSPLSLKGSLESLTQFNNFIYRNSFLKDLRKKYKIKMQDFPEKISTTDIKKINSLLAFDSYYTAPAHGFKDAFDYYEKNSSVNFIANIKIPVLILNAENDTFLSPDCYPREIAATSKNIYLETPKYGGHVGFHISNDEYYSEMRTLEFLDSDISN